jgi:hypothetical protein
VQVRTRFAAYTLRILKPRPTGDFRTIDFEIVNFVRDSIKPPSLLKQQDVDIHSFM